ncbi:chemotaxis protein CheC [Bdellovibrionota bacterium FG-2]
MTIQLTEKQKDALTELVNIGVGKAADVLNQMIEHRVELKTPEVRLMDPAEFARDFCSGFLTLSTVSMDFSGELKGIAAILFPPKSAANLVITLNGEDTGGEGDMDSIRASTLSEVGNIVSNSVLGSLANIVKKRIQYSVPFYEEAQLRQSVFGKKLNFATTCLVATAQFSVNGLDLKGDLLLVFEIDSIQKLLNEINAMWEGLD